MILSALIEVVNLLIMAALMLFPEWEPPVDSPSWTALSAANIVLPLDTWSMLMGVTIGVMGAALGVWVIKLAVNLIRGSGA
ncbi:hypothetical protein ACFP81_14545 [Deinococcus lacus]|uniref:Uncharacterized protein n=1 Tax=Deinococcus lacus TaxID=392561 RepID=A0ABW1YFJ6_9DEIO